MNFFGIYDNILTKKECEILISQFEKSPQIDGVTSALQPEHSAKKCKEIDGCDLSKTTIVSNIIRPRLISIIDRYKDKYKSLSYLGPWKYCDQYNFQKYETEDDGFKLWHTEAGVVDNSHRVLAWMFYLNNAKSGTEFYNYPTVRAKMGRGVIWPAGFTHVHRGAPNKGLKYIVTGWIAFS